METAESAPEARRAKPKLTRPGSRLNTGDALPDTEFDRPDPLAGDRIMDATARLLAPRRSVLTQEHSSGAQRAAASSRKRKKTASQPKAEHAEGKKAEGKKSAHKQEETVKAAPHKKRERSGSAAKAQRKDGPAPRQDKRRTQNRGGNRRGMPMEPMKSGQTKDSTEQQSLMKPYYLDMGR